MSESQKLQQELDQMNAKFNQVKSENNVTDNAPKIERSYTYRKSPAIKSTDIGSL